MAKFIFIYITNPDQKTAETIANTLLERKLIACANIFPIKSIYSWKKKIVKEKEVILIAKTTSSKFSKIEKIITKTHPYKVPCIIKINVWPNSRYAKWLVKNLT